jgi:hypothetical protein
VSRKLLYGGSGQITFAITPAGAEVYFEGNLAGYFFPRSSEEN